MTAMLAFCTCGHTRDDHVAGRACTHINASKRFDTPARCLCARFHFDPRLNDAEEFLAKQLNQIIRKEGISLEDADKQDLLQVMRISMWAASTKYDSRSHIRFGSFAAFEVYNDAIDELRSSRMFGRHGQYRLQHLAARGDDNDSWIIDPVDPLDDDASGSRRLDGVIAELTVDPPDVGAVALRWALSEDDRTAVGAAARDGRRTDHSAAGRAVAAAWSDGLTALIQTTEEAA